MAKKKYLKNPITGKKMGLVGLAALGVGGYLVYTKFIKKQLPKRTPTTIPTTAAQKAQAAKATGQNVV
jgi:uncharacterized membrane protein YebE (DUF533 family)